MGLGEHSATGGCRGGQQKASATLTSAADHVAKTGPSSLVA